MLKFEWKELPDWKDDDYWKLFEQSATQPSIAWEFLRRKPEYRADYARLAELMSQGTGWRNADAAKVYFPPRHPDESKNRWMSRIVQDFNLDPTITPLDVFLANKWGMEAIHDPFLPFTPTVRFLEPGRDFPRLVSRPEDFDELIVAGDLEAGGDIPVIADWCAPLVFDITRPLDAQLEQAGRVLRQYRQRLKTEGRFNKAAGMNEKPDVWVRHLRVIDALRTLPKPTSEQIAIVLGDNATKDALKHERRKQGGNFIREARKKLNADHRRILLAAPRKNPPQT